jgi:acetyl esterase
MPVTSEVQNLLDMIAAVNAPPPAEQTPAEVREAYAMLSSFTAKEDVGAVEDRVIPGPGGDIPVRVYRPAGAATAAAADDRLPGVLVYFHGGGWSIGSIDTHDPVCRALANGSGAVVVSVEYRLAPEHPFPAGYDDALAAVRWVAANGDELGVDAGRLAVGGDSAGGNLAAVAAQQLRDGGPAIAFQLLVYPAVDMTLSYPSIDENGEGKMLTKETMLWFRANYIGPPGTADERDPRVSPLHAPAEALAGLPPALVITAEYDPLRDEGDAYAEALRAAGVDVTHTSVDGVIHGFFSLRDMIPEGKVAVDQACEALARSLS